VNSHLPFRHSSDNLFTRIGAVLRSPYQAFRQILREVIPLEHRRRTVRFIRRRMSRVWGSSAASTAASLNALSSLLARTERQRYDLICFPIINWDFRFQRPQQLMSRLAAVGHRVFYINQHFLDHGPPYKLAMKGKNIYEVSLNGPDLNIYTDALDPAAQEVLFASLDALRRELSLGATAAFVQLPFWRLPAERVRERFGWPIIYDCLDYHAGFSTNRPEMFSEEEALISSADCVLVSSRFLEQRVSTRARRRLLVRNACDYEHFARVSTRPSGPRPVIGYYGAIADWFDADLVAELAERHPEWDFVLVGATFSADLRRLGRLRNVSLPGEQPYAELPERIDKMDVLILPFKRTPLTEATNPVKAYEIFAAGKPLVSMPLPEMREMSPPARLAGSVEEFEREIVRALGETAPALVEERRAFARKHTWDVRVTAVESAVRESFPLISIIVVTYNNLELNRVCLQSIYTNTEWPNFEVVVVDNASTDGTPGFLREAAETYANLRVIFNENNRGFAAANNQGLAVARGAYLILLNNDTVVPRGWATSLVRHLMNDARIGMIGPVTNEIGNEAKVPVEYKSLEEMPAWAAEYVRKRDNETFDIQMLAMFCVAFRREVYAAIGALDERFGIGMFEDDDYARRLRAAGYRLVCARDSFVHHVGSASFNKLIPVDYYDLFERNRKLYEEKWSEVWQPHVDAAAKTRIPLLRAELRRLIGEAKGDLVIIFPPGESWFGVTPGRRQQLALALAQQGCLVFYNCSSSQRDNFFGFESVASRLWLYKGPNGVLEESSAPVLWTTIHQAPLIRDWSQARVVYDSAEESFTTRNGERHHELLDRAALVVCATADDLSKLQKVRTDAVHLPDADANSGRTWDEAAQLVIARLQQSGAHQNGGA
jgi:GT2 family glycosyltransferase/glycosyltransferase involved in cell wall biosynthesis